MQTTRRRRSAPRWIDPFTPEHIRRLVAEFGSPLLIVDCARVRAQYRNLARALPGVDLHYALKPLPHAAVIEAIREKITPARTLLLSSHLVDELEKIVDYAVFMKTGEVVLEGVSQELRASRQKSLVEMYKEIYAQGGHA